MNNPLVSIIIPTYNRVHLIGETLDSVLAQTYTNWECIIVDDGSTDNSDEVVSSYVKRDSRFQYHHRPIDRPKGGNAARNYGFELSKGQYVKWFDSDDIMLPFFIDKQVSILQQDFNLDFCVCQGQYFFENGEVKNNYINLKPKNHPIYSYFLESHVFATPSPLWKKEFLKDKDLFDLKLFRSQEADFHFRMLTYNPNYSLHEDFLFQVRRGHGSIESNSINKTAQLSVLRFFNKAFYITQKLDFPLKDILLRYLIYRNVSQVYSLVVQENLFKGRIKYFHFYKNIIDSYKYISLINFFKIFIGFTFLLIFKRGHDLMHLKCYDYRRFCLID